MSKRRSTSRTSTLAVPSAPQCFWCRGRSSVPRRDGALAHAIASDLGLKFIVHRGEFSRQQIGHAVQLYGTDVNLVHRLAKNTVPLREYVFATDATLAGWPESVRQGFVAAPQRYDVGEVG